MQSSFTNESLGSINNIFTQLVIYTAIPPSAVRVSSVYQRLYLHIAYHKAVYDKAADDLVEGSTCIDGPSNASNK